MTETVIPAGLPEALPRGERILWRGRPDAVALALAAFRIGWVGAYFAALFGWRLISGLWDGAPVAEALVDALWIVPLAAAGIVILAVIAWFAARTTIYTVTDQRVVLRIGIALPLTVNLPFSQIDSAAVKPRGRGTGDIAFGLKAGSRLGYAVLWPHARSWHFARPQPALRAIPDVDAVAARLATALGATTTQRTTAAERGSEPMPHAFGAAAE